MNTTHRTDPQVISTRARHRLDKEFGELQMRRWLDGKADRAAMGTPDKTFGQIFEEASRSIDRFVKAFQAVWPPRPRPEDVALAGPESEGAGE